MQEQLRKIVAAQEASPYAIAKHCEIDKSAMSRFINGSPLSTTNIEKLTKGLGLVVGCTLSISPLNLGRPKR